MCVALPIALLVVANRQDDSSAAPPDSAAAGVSRTTPSSVDLSHLPQPGDNAPGFIVQDLDGNAVSLADYAGRPVVLAFFASWCFPCEEEMPLLERAWEDHTDERLAVLGVVYRDRTEDVRAFLDDYEVSFPVLLDPDHAIERAYRVGTIPMTFFIGPDGQVVDRGFGLTTEDVFQPFLERLLDVTPAR